MPHSILLLTLLMKANLCMASYVNDWVYKGEVVNTPTKSKDGRWKVRLKILLGAPGGRTDGTGKKGEAVFHLELQPNEAAPKRGQTIWVKSLTKSDRSGEAESTILLSEP
ncbi:MAG: hypothetical protein EBX52_11750, partial [Proteobacteria bacterium]|nr:hypothetical protein [Pseudomonadota bacterium]